MYKFFRMFFCILAVVCAAVAILIFTFFDLWGLLPVGVGLASAGLMFLFKNLQEREEHKKDPPAPRGDFITGRVGQDGENKNQGDI